MKRRFRFTKVLGVAMLCLLAAALAQAQTCAQQGFGLGGTGSPIPNGRSFGSNQAWRLDSGGPPLFTAGTWSGYWYIGGTTGVVGGGPRHVLEGIYLSNSNTPSSCHTAVLNGHTAPCDSSDLPEVIVPDMCGLFSSPIEYTHRGFGHPDQYLPFNHNGVVITARPKPPGDGSCVVESEKYNIIPGLNVAYGAGTNAVPVGNCIATQPQTQNGNFDWANFLWYTPSQIDAMNNAWNKFLTFLSSQCDSVNGHCGNDTWTNIVRNTPLPNLTAGSHVTNPGFGDNGSDPTTEILTVDLVCPNSSCGMSGSTLTSYVANQIFGNMNSVGYRVQSAMQSFGLPIQITVIVNPPAQIGQIGHNEAQGVTKMPVLQYYTGVVLNLINHRTGVNETVIGLVFNSPPDQIAGTLFTRVGSKDCSEELAASPFTADMVQVGGRLVSTFSTTLTATNVQWGANQGNTINPPNYCTYTDGSNVHVGDVFTISGTGTCATTDIHELCNQQFQLTVNGHAGNLMRIHSQYLGGSASKVPNIDFVNPVSHVPALPQTYWDSTRRCLNGTCNRYPLLFSIYDPSYPTAHMGAYVIAGYLDGYINPGQESQMDLNAGTASGYEGFGIQVGIGPLDIGFNVAFPVAGGFFDGGFGGIFDGTEGGRPPGGFGDY